MTIPPSPPPRRSRTPRCSEPSRRCPGSRELSLVAGELLDGLEAVARDGQDEGCARHGEKVDETGENTVGDFAAVEVPVALDRGLLVAAPVDEPEVRGRGKEAGGDGEESLPTGAITLGTEVGESRREPGRIAAVVLDAPEVDLLELVEVGREPLQVEEDATGGVGQIGRLDDDRLAREERFGEAAQGAAVSVTRGFFLPCQNMSR